MTAGVWDEAPWLDAAANDEAPSPQASVALAGLADDERARIVAALGERLGEIAIARLSGRETGRGCGVHVLVVDAAACGGVDGLRRLLGPDPTARIVIVTEGAAAEELHALVALGRVTRVLVRPLAEDDLALLCEVVSRAAFEARERTRLALLEELGRNQALVTPLPGRGRGATPSARSAAMQACQTAIASAARASHDVCLVGEPGTGRSLLAAELHGQSARSGHPIVPLPAHLVSAERGIDPARGAEVGLSPDALVSAKWRAAGLGALLVLDLEELHRDVQRALVERIASAGRLRARLVATSAVDPARLVADDLLDPTLGAWLAAGTIRVPALRERPEDLATLAAATWREVAGPVGRGDEALDPRLLAFLERDPLEENLRDLRAWVERALAGLPIPAPAA